MDDYITPCSTFICVRHQLTYKLADLFIYLFFYLFCIPLDSVVHEDSNGKAIALSMVKICLD